MFKNKDFLVSVCALVTSVAAVVLSVYSMYAGGEQKKVENLVLIYEFLHEPDLSAARSTVRSAGAEVSLLDDSSRKVMSSFDYAGNLVRNGAVAENLFFDYWGVPLDNLGEQFESKREEKISGGIPEQEYYRDFYWLLDESVKRK
jgi:hypothetical protein